MIFVDNYLIKFQFKTNTNTHRYVCKMGVVQLDMNCIVCIYLQENFIVSITVKMLTYSKTHESMVACCVTLVHSVSSYKRHLDPDMPRGLTLP